MTKEELLDVADRAMLQLTDEEVENTQRNYQS